MSEFRGPHDFRSGDRVLVVDDEGLVGVIRAGEIRTVCVTNQSGVTLVGATGSFISNERFLRIAEQGEEVPDGAVTRSITCAMVGDNVLGFRHPFGRMQFPRVVVSVPPVESERERKLRELGEQIEKLQAKYDDLAGVGE